VADCQSVINKDDQGYISFTIIDHAPHILYIDDTFFPQPLSLVIAEVGRNERTGKDESGAD
jgi:hypothetical protein